MEPLNPGCFASGIMGQKNPGGVLNVTIFAIAQPLLIEANIFVITTHRPGAIMQDHTLPPKKFCRPAWLSGHRKCCSALWRWRAVAGSRQPGFTQLAAPLASPRRMISLMRWWRAASSNVRAEATATCLRPVFS